MYEVSEAAKAAKIASYSREKIEKLRAWAVREREWIHPSARPLMGSIPDRALRDIAQTLEAADVNAAEVQVPRIGAVSGAQLRMVSGWVVAEVKSRHVVEWHAASDCGYAWLAERAASVQGVSVEAVDWDSVEDELFDELPSAYELALLELGPTSDVAAVIELEGIANELSGAH